MIYKFFDKKTSSRAVKNEIFLTMNQLKNFTNQLLKKFKKKAVQSPFLDNISREDLADMQLIRKLNQGIRFHYVLLVFLVNTHGLFL